MCRVEPGPDAACLRGRLPPVLIVRYTGSSGKAMDWKTLLRDGALIFLGGGLGAVLRVGASAWMEARVGERLPFVGILTVNLVGCFLIGLAAESLEGTAKLAVVGGFLGALTTYSSFALFTTQLGGEGRTVVLAIQLTAHLVGGVACVLAGIAASRALSGA